MSREALGEDMQLQRSLQAAEWFLRVSAEDLSERELAEWLKWCNDPDNATEYRRMSQVWNGVDQIRPAASAALESARAQHSSTPRRFATRWVAVALSAGVSALVVSALWYARDSGILSFDHNIVAADTRNHSARLPDGSRVILAPRTQVAVDFEGQARHIDLSLGEAFFKVYPNKTRPFVVQAGELSVTAVGTAFDVRSGPDRTVVTVQEGSVEVARMGHDASSANSSWRVSSGYQVVYDKPRGDVHIAAADASHSPAWQRGQLRYFAEPLGAIVADVNRYSPRVIEIRDPEVARLAFTGTIFTDDIDDWLGALQSTFPLRAIIAPDQHIVLRSDPSRR